MSISVELTMKCNHNGCTETIVQEGENVTRRSIKLAARKEGWQKKSADVHYCPTHSTKNGEGKAKKVTAKKSSKVTKKVPKKTLASGVSKRKGPAVFEFGKGAEEKPAPSEGQG